VHGKWVLKGVRNAVHFLMRPALESQERLLVVLREQVAEGGNGAARVGDLEASVQVRVRRVWIELERPQQHCSGIARNAWQVGARSRV
jgi:hypothetical protein